MRFHFGLVNIENQTFTANCRIFRDLIRSLFPISYIRTLLKGKSHNVIWKCERDFLSRWFLSKIIWSLLIQFCELALRPCLKSQVTLKDLEFRLINLSNLFERCGMTVEGERTQVYKLSQEFGEVNPWLWFFSVLTISIRNKSCRGEPLVILYCLLLTNIFEVSPPLSLILLEVNPQFKNIAFY